MRFWFAILSALALALSFSTAGRTADAAAAPCMQQDIQLTDRADGATEEPAGCPLSGTPHHHHAPCSVHVGTPPADASVDLSFADSSSVSAFNSDSLSGRGPSSLLRPPIA